MRGAVFIEVALIVTLVAMLSFSALVRVGYYSGTQFCKPVQSMSDDGTVISGVTRAGACKWEEGSITKKFVVNKLF